MPDYFGEYAPEHFPALMAEQLAAWKAEKFAREYGTEERVEWVRWLPSVVSGKKPCVNAHVRTGGTSYKADACWIVPLTNDEHHELHQHGIKTFSAKYNIDLDAAARMVELQWQSHLTTTARPAW